MLRRGLSLETGYIDSEEAFELQIKTTDDIDIKLDRLFHQAFGEHHTKRFYSDLGRRSRWKLDQVTYRFTLPELIESFCHTYSPDQLADFFDRNVEGSRQAKWSLVNRIRQAEKLMRIVYVEKCLRSPDNVQYKVGPVNFHMDEMRDILACVFSKKYVVDGEWEASSGWFEGTRLLGIRKPALYDAEFRRKFPKDKPNAILVPTKHFPKSLSDIDIIRYCCHDTKHLGLKIIGSEREVVKGVEARFTRDVLGDYVDLHVNPDGVLFDIVKVFDTAFGSHAAHYEYDLEKRRKEKDDGVHYSMPFIEFIESFCADYTPEKLVKFLDMNVEYPNGLIRKIKRVRKDLKMIYLEPQPLRSSQKITFFASPINFPMGEFKDMLSTSILGKRVIEFERKERRWSVWDRRYGDDFDDPYLEMIGISGHDITPVNFKKRLPKGDKPIAVVVPSFELPYKLDDISLASWSQISLDGLEIVRL